MFYGFAKVVLTVFYSILFPVRTKGLENIPQSGGAVLCANHISNHDPLALAVFAPRVVRYMAKKELFDMPFISALVNWLHAFPVDRKANDTAAIKTAIKALKNGDIIGIFAQGTRVLSGEAKAAKSGAALIAIKSGAPIIPVSISGRYRLFGRVNIVYGEPIYFEELAGQRLTSDLLERAISVVMNKVEELRGS